MEQNMWSTSARMGFGEAPGILVVDFSKGFTSTQCSMGGNYDRQITAANRVLEVARQKNFPIVFTTVGYRKSMMDDGIWTVKFPGHTELQIGSPWVELDDRLGFRKESETLLLKKGSSAFFGTNLVSVLVSQGVDTLVVMGCTTSGCIRSTVIDACQYGYRAIVPEECVGDRCQQAHDANLYDIDVKFGDVMSLELVLQELIKYPGKGDAQ